MKGGKENLDKISEEFNIEKIIAKILINRDLKYEEIDKFLYGDKNDLNNPLDMKDMDIATDIIIKKIKENKKIRIIGDYDQDGVSSTVILIKALRELSQNIDYKIPNRVIDGYGINERLVEEAKEEGVDLIITCDNGIAAFEAVDKAKEIGLDIIISDHHDIPIFIEDKEKVYRVPKADAIVNPKQVDCKYPFKNICGAVVALKICEAIYEKVGIAKEKLENLYQFAAMATICDVVDLKDENRIIVKMGLEKINNSENIGLKALIRETGLEDKKIGVYHLGFVLGPCINASGRLDTAGIAVELFTSEDIKLVEKDAKLLVSLNNKRKEMTEKGLKQTIRMIEESEIKDDNILIVYNPDIHESIAGIIAGRIKEQYYKPTIVLTSSKNEGFAKGSGRSIEEYDMFSELSRLKELFERFGGHPMAAGLTILEENIDEFRKRLNQNSKLSKQDLIEKIYIDAQMPIEGIKLNLPERLSILEPFGKANRKPTFGDKNIKVLKIAILGQNYKIVKFSLKKGQNQVLEAIYFGDIDQILDYLKKKFSEEEVEKAMNGLDNEIYLDLIYYPNINEFRGERNLQIIIQDYR